LTYLRKLVEGTTRNLHIFENGMQKNGSYSPRSVIGFHENEIWCQLVAVYACLDQYAIVGNIGIYWP
jgi:hypothetical protein